MMNMKYNLFTRLLAAFTLLFIFVNCSHTSTVKTNSTEDLVTKIDPSSPEVISMGRQLFEKSCSTCHGSDGLGQGETAMYLTEKIPSFKSPNFKHGNSNEQIFNTIKNGVTKTSMKSFASELSDKEIWYLTFYVKSFQSN